MATLQLTATSALSTVVTTLGMVQKTVHVADRSLDMASSFVNLHVTKYERYADTRLRDIDTEVDRELAKHHASVQKEIREFCKDPEMAQDYNEALAELSKRRGLKLVAGE